jgi:acetyl-CoA synthetase
MSSSPPPNHHHAHEIAEVLPPIGTADLTFEGYKEAYGKSIGDVSSFWKARAGELIDWYQPPLDTLSGSFEEGDVTWFAGGKLNVCHNAIDRHVHAGKGDQVAMVWEGDEPSEVKRLTYSDLQRLVSRIAAALKSVGVGKGDVVTLYMPMVPELPATMLACARIGAMHSVVFAGFSSEALAQRIVAARSRVVVTADQGQRGGKPIPLKDIVNEARTKLGAENVIQNVLVWERFYEKGSEQPSGYAMHPKDVRMDPLVAEQRPYCPPEVMDAEDPFFILYTSGSTGKPKGLLHTTGGYAVYAAFTTQNTFALAGGDLFACVADCGWITGHTYVVYGPLLCGSTTFVFESTPVYPDPGRYWDMIQRHRITQFYTAPTAIRLLMRYGDEIPAKYDTSSLKVLGTVGEPINPEAWRWYYEVVGKSRCTVVDTYWQTESGGHLLTNFPGVYVAIGGFCFGDEGDRFLTVERHLTLGLFLPCLKHWISRTGPR